MADELLNGSARGAIAQIKTGEGKTFIIAVLSILLVQCGRLVDISTSNMELASRDQKSQKKYYDLFGIASDILYSTETECAYVDYPPGPGQGSTDDCEYSLNSLNAPIVYSTHTNYEWLYLRALFRNKPFRTRRYDIAIVDEADHALLDGATSPAVIAQSLPVRDGQDICRFVWNIVRQNPKHNPASITQMLRSCFPDAKLTDDNIAQLIRDAVTAATRHRLDENYVIRNGKIEIIDRNNGFLQPGCRWRGFLHSMLEIKEGQEVKCPTVSVCGISQRDFFMFYRGLCGVTGTLGNENDKRILREAYKVCIFEVPKNLESQKGIVQCGRNPEVERSFGQIVREANQVAATGRPVLIIFEYPREVDEFANIYFPHAGRIKGLDPSEDRPSIQVAGESGRITIATPAAGRGTDITPDSRAKAAGGLHVIIAKVPRTQRALEQVVGRSGRQGQPGSATILLEPNQLFYGTAGFSDSGSNAYKLQARFAHYIKGTYPWLFEGRARYGFETFEVPFGSDYKDILEASCEYTVHLSFPPKIPWNLLDEEILISYLRQVIMLSWGMLFTYLWDNPSISNSMTQCNKMYDVFVADLHEWLPKNARSSLELLSSMHGKSVKGFFRRVDLRKLGIQLRMAGAGISLMILSGGSLTPVAIPITLAAMEGCTSLYDKVKTKGFFNLGIVDFAEIALRTLGGLAEGTAWVSPIGRLAEYLLNIAIESGVTFGVGLINGRPLAEIFRETFGTAVETATYTGISSLASWGLEKLFRGPFRQKVKQFLHGLEVPKEPFTGTFGRWKPLRTLILGGMINGIEVDEAVLDMLLTLFIEYDAPELLGTDSEEDESE
jgi:hypothetical protein